MNEQNKFCGLDVTGILLYQTQTCLWREERNQSLILVSLRDNKTGESGHVLYYAEVDKRDFLEEETWTDNPKLFETNHGDDGAVPQELLGLAKSDTPTQRTEEIDAILGACWDGSQVEYKEGDEGWGLYADWQG